MKEEVLNSNGKVDMCNRCNKIKPVEEFITKGEKRDTRCKVCAPKVYDDVWWDNTT
jgi:hypothetical protein